VSIRGEVVCPLCGSKDVEQRWSALRGIMNGPDGKAIHAELTLRRATRMLGPENSAMGKRTAKTLGGSPAGL